MELNSADNIQGERNYTYWSPTIFVEASASPMDKLILFSRVHYHYQDYYDDEFDRRDNQFGFTHPIAEQAIQIGGKILA